MSARAWIAAALCAVFPAQALADAAVAPVPAYPPEVAAPPPLVSAPSPQVARAPAPPAAPPPVASMSDMLRADFGLAAPLGFLGIAYDHTFAEVFALEGGLGWGVSGVQLALMPRLFVGSLNHRLTLALGPSLGVPTDRLDAGENPRQTIVFINAEVGYDLRTDSGFSFEIAFGASVIANSVQWNPICISDCGTPLGAGSTFPNFRVGIGHWF